MKRRSKPRYLEIRRNHNGSVRYYWRPRGGRPIRLPDDPGEAWREAEILNQRRDIARAGGPIKPPSGTVARMIEDFEASPDFEGLAAKTRKEYAKVFAWLRQKFGDLPPEAIGPEVVQAIKGSGRDAPWQTNARIRLIRLLFNWARRAGRVKDNPAQGFRQLRTTARESVWTPADVLAFVSAARPSMALAVMLGLYTLQREGDLIALPWAAYAGGMITLRQTKTGRPISAPAVGELRNVLDAAPRRGETILVSEATGKPYSEDHFRHTFARDRAAAGISVVIQFRDLRRTGAVTLGRLRVPTQHIAALGGWSISRTAKILETYIPLDSYMAEAAIIKLEKSMRQAA